MFNNYSLRSITKSTNESKFLNLITSVISMVFLLLIVVFFWFFNFNMAEAAFAHEVNVDLSSEIRTPNYQSSGFINALKLRK